MKKINLHHLLNLWYLSNMANNFNQMNKSLEKKYSAFLFNTKNKLILNDFLEIPFDLINYNPEHKKFISMIFEKIKTSTDQERFKNFDFSNEDILLKFLNEVSRNKDDISINEEYDLTDEEYGILKHHYITSKKFLNERWSFIIDKNKVIKQLEESEIKRFKRFNRKMLGERLTGDEGSSIYELNQYFNLIP